MSQRATMFLRNHVASTIAAGAGVVLVVMAAGCDDTKDAASSATSAAGSAVATATDKASSAVNSATGENSSSAPSPSSGGVPGILESPTASAPPAPVVPSTQISTSNGKPVSITDPAITAEYAARGYEKGYLGRPLGPVVDLPSGGKFLTLQGGSIYLNPTTKKAYSVHGAIGGFWGAAGHETSKYGYPNGEETPVEGGVQQSFDNATLIDKNGSVTVK